MVAGQNGTATKWHGRQIDTVRHFGTTTKLHGVSLWHEGSLWHRDKIFKLFFSNFILGFWSFVVLISSV